MNLKFAHICIHAKDLAETERFYTDVLGMDRSFGFYKDGKLFGIYLRISEKNFIEVFQAGDAPSDSSPIAHLCLETSDIDADLAELRASGVEATDKKTGSDGTYQIWLADPNGVRIELHQYTDDSCQVTGKDIQITT